MLRVVSVAGVYFRKRNARSGSVPFARWSVARFWISTSSYTRDLRLSWKKTRLRWELGALVGLATAFPLVLCKKRPSWRR